MNVDGMRCPPEEDKKLWDYRRMKPQREPKVFDVKARWGSVPSEAVCSCGHRTSKRVCPACHNSLPSEFGKMETITIAMIGAKASGKSNYIAVLIHELQNRIGTEFNASLLAQDDETEDRYKRDFKRYVFDSQLVVPVTDASGSYQLRYPLIYKLSLGGKRFGMNTRREIMLVFFDTAGENLDQLDRMSTETRYICNADGLVFLLDPMQIEGVRNQLPQTVPLPRIYTAPEEIMNRAGRLIRNVTGRSPKIPVAVTFSKVDEIRSVLDDGSPLHRSSEHAGYYDETDGEDVHENLRGHLRKWTADSFENTMKGHFDQTFRYFGLSALGSSPDASGRLLRGVAPFRVEDPFLWLLSKSGFIEAKRRK